MAGASNGCHIVNIHTSAYPINDLATPSASAIEAKALQKN
jgi:hypothetical protein